MESTPPGLSRKEFIEKYLYPLVLIPIPVFLSTWWNGRDKDRHDLSTEVLKSGNAAPADVMVIDPLPELEGLGAHYEPGTVVEGDPWIYTALVKNQGDFTEEEVRVFMHINYMTGLNYDIQSVSVVIRASSPLLELEVRDADNGEPAISGISFMLPVDRLNPGEWVTIETQWLTEVEVRVEARSKTDSDMAIS